MTEVTEVPVNSTAREYPNDQDIREAVDSVDTLFEAEYLQGKEDRVGYFPILENLPGRPILARFSYGVKAPNYSTKYFASERGESEVTGLRNRRDFLEELGFVNYPNVIQLVGRFEGLEPQMEEVSLDTLKDKNIVVGNMLFTRDPRISGDIIPADCPSGVLSCRDGYMRIMGGLIHGGRDALNAGMVRQGLWLLRDEYGVDLKDAVLAISPGVLAKNYFITNEPERRGNGIVERNWGEFITERQTEDLSEKRHVDLTSAFVMQAVQAGMDPKKIQTYGGVNTYADAAAGKAYSRRYSNEHNGARPGGQIVAFALNPQYIQETINPLPMAA
ncbi:MAG: hypothetical protein A2171_02900 [Candidatus Levybacteria bacterium RBG_13_35_9]|nr:MAG: hypothetical protein A2171_02900 [Candidatus Levybacteria bacterium RBG_13_35_9]